MRFDTRGFTLLELLVVLTIVGILASIVFVGLDDSQAQARDAKRQADLRQVENAVELFKNKYGHYPSGCNGSTTSHNTTNWSGEAGTGFECGSGNQYIVNLAPEFMPELPRDPRAGAGGNASGYVYTTNDEGSVYKFMALNSVETETIDQLHEFYRCDRNSFFLAGGSNTNPNESWNDDGICWQSRTNFNGPIAQHRTQFSECTTPSEFENDYAVSAGFSSDDRGANTSSDKGREYDTEIVRCK